MPPFGQRGRAVLFDVVAVGEVTVQGTAIRTCYRPDRPTSIFVFGNDFNVSSIETVIRTVRHLNRKDATGRSLMRIHTFGFPVYATVVRQPATLIRFSHLMRLLAEQNSGTFVGLNAVR